MRASRASLVVAAAAAALTLAACGSDDSSPTASAANPQEPSQAMDMSAGGGDMGGMTKLAETDPTSDLDVGLFAMPPETFYVSEGDGLRKQAPAKTDDAHLMVTLADKESGVRLPDATVTAQVLDAKGATAFEGPLYPMVGRGMGLHYGENVDVGAPGDYDVKLTIGPPRVGRHRAVQNAWSKTTKVVQKVTFDGKKFAPVK